MPPLIPVRWTTSLVLALTGCVAVNPAYQDSGASTSAGSDTGSGAPGSGPASGKDDASAEGTGISGVTGMDSVGVTTDTSDSDPTSSAEASDTLSQLDVGRPGCTGAWQTLEEDAFLVRCQSCSNSNYGGTSQRFVGELDTETSILLLRSPQTDGSVSGVDVILHVVASPLVAEEDFDLRIEAVVPPCDWEAGNQNGQPLPAGDTGVTWNNCDANAGSLTLWGDETSALAHVDPAWDAVTVSVDGGTLDPGEPTPISFTLNRPRNGRAPAALVVSSSVSDPEGLAVLAFGSDWPAEISLKVDCER